MVLARFGVRRGVGPAVALRIAFVAAALSTLALGAIACSTQRQDGQDCLKDDDCESDFCVAHVCVQPGAGQPTADSAPPVDSGSPEAAADASDAAGDSPAAPAGPPPPTPPAPPPPPSPAP